MSENLWTAPRSQKASAAPYGVHYWMSLY